MDWRGAPTADTAFMGLTSCRRFTIAKTLAPPRRECAIGITPIVALSNAPPTAAASSVMGLIEGVCAARGVDGWGVTVCYPKWDRHLGRPVGWRFRSIRP